MLFINQQGNVHFGIQTEDSFPIPNAPSKFYKIKSNWSETYPDVWEFDTENQVAKIKQDVDKKTQALIAQGFKFKRSIFSLSQNAQINWMALKNQYDMNLFPDEIEISRLDGKAYILKKEDFLDFYTAAFTTVKDILDAGRALKVSADKINTEKKLSEFIDNR
jgi:hypothetical protein